MAQHRSNDIIGDLNKHRRERMLRTTETIPSTGSMANIPEPTRTQRWAIKRVLNKYRSILEHARKNTNDAKEDEQRHKCIEALKVVQEILYLENEETGEEYTIEDFLEMELTELIMILEKSLKELGQII